ncbi:MAG: hypothetical protein AB7H77_05970 [Bdellovibrionales bacterium]
MTSAYEEPGDEISEYATVLEAWSKVKLDKPLRDAIWGAIHAAEIIYAFPDTPAEKITNFNVLQQQAERELFGARTKQEMPADQIYQGITTLSMATSLVKNMVGPERQSKVRILAISYDS